jgi:hypothetical protein
MPLTVPLAGCATAEDDPMRLHRTTAKTNEKRNVRILFRPFVTTKFAAYQINFPNAMAGYASSDKQEALAEKLDPTSAE